MAMEGDMTYQGLQFASEDTYCGINQESAEKTTGEKSQSPEEDSPEAKGSSNIQMPRRVTGFIIIFIIQLVTIIAVVFLFLQLSRQLELNNNEVLLLNIKLKESEEKITAMGRNQTSLQMLLKQVEEKLTVMTKNQSTLQTNVSQAEQKITALEGNRGQTDIQSKCCPPQWQKFEHSCYFLTTFSESWQNAKMHCQRQSSTLVVINSAGEQDFLRQNVEDLNRKLNQQLWYWIGLTDTEVEGRWKWVDGTLCDCRNNANSYWYVDSNVREPDDWDNNEDCVLMRGDGRWGDKNCDDNRRWICEKQTERCPP
ncbi:asialoglycoprotein receptor 1-like [Protopterus annectens]|uniref:asialoglycoprotein receptor 1-like n=1 Tax=Protopterus annectens TaxID=7888 RepID=UPI001CFA63EB|nr:asialoglycoprotein receptor 1-like [Protopterus annectens]